LGVGLETRVQLTKKEAGQERDTGNPRKSGGKWTGGIRGDSASQKKNGPKGGSN